MTVRDEMIVLGPHRLEGCVLLDVFPTPDLQVGVELTEPLADRLADHWDTAETAMVAISFMQSALDFKVGHSRGLPRVARCLLDPTIQSLSGWRIGAVWSPERFCPLPNRGHVCSFDQQLNASRVTTEMSRNSFV
jgi:hypothetical protein